MIRRFLSYYKPHIGIFILDMTAAIVIAACNLFYPTVAKNIINDYVFRDTPTMLIIFSAILLGIYVITNVMQGSSTTYERVLSVSLLAVLKQLFV